MQLSYLLKNKLIFIDIIIYVTIFLIVFSWFHPNCTKNEAVDMLVKAGPGSFLVRPSDNSPGDYSLFFHINNQIQRFRIEKKGVRYLMGGRTFECLDAVIHR
jgi:Ras GTPase-activating protein 1